MLASLLFTGMNNGIFNKFTYLLVRVWVLKLNIKEIYRKFRTIEISPFTINETFVGNCKIY